MSRPILSRPRTRVYGCNYDKGESYYKPMVDHLDRKYSSRPLFSEPRTSLADEIAARRGDIGSRDLPGPRNNSLGRDLDPEIDPLIRAPTVPLSSLANDPLFPENEEIVYDSRGQRRRRFAENFANEVAATTQHLKAKLATFGLDDEVDATLGKSRRLRQEQEFLENSLNARRDMQDMRSTIEDAESAFSKRRSKLLDEIDNITETKPMLTKWSKLLNEDENLLPVSAAATRAKQTKARLNDLESEMEELSERQAKRERRAAALRALVNENIAHAVQDQNVQDQSIVSKKVSIRERSEKHVAF
ncbi:uncharacterized protein LOC128891466 [Hylaeus anthracinus]|uniref:uncharacterized protein LOC128891466 n=1 Tax=Hylaeus anthracinus TaxID=313031 RepID=UPI0023B96820|nr:uncharacterized protein LOC128891466 [Hylaeus anthracinus]XP_054006941.1 uncharacterized protein LOC128891466 [Hylaeus anthracinus]XP_054006942.1 uncharacterized protein LOC128891466 [Hylaeus anthracinus]XP_054006943.1 uncharacterized protein LOC128891466 [Hylaeus anthracinus]